MYTDLSKTSEGNSAQYKLKEKSYDQFISYQKVFDKIQHSATISKTPSTKNSLNLINETKIKTKLTLNIIYTTTEIKKRLKSERLGCQLSPHLFSTVLEVLISKER